MLWWKPLRFIQLQGPESAELCQRSGSALVGRAPTGKTKVRINASYSITLMLIYVHTVGAG